MPQNGFSCRKLFAMVLIASFTGLIFWTAALIVSQFKTGQACELYAARIQAITETVHSTLARLAALPETIAIDPAGIAKPFAQAVEGNPLYITVGLSDADGASIFSTYRQAKNTSLQDRRYFQETLKRRSFVAGEFVLGKMSGLGVFHFSMPVVDQQGVMTGTINIAVNLKHLAQALRLDQVPQGATLHLVDHRGILLCTSQEPERHPGDSLPDADFSWLRGLKAPGGAFITQEGKRNYRYGKPLLLADGTPYAYLMLTMDTSYHTGRALLLFELLLLAAGAVFLVRLLMRKNQVKAPPP